MTRLRPRKTPRWALVLASVSICLGGAEVGLRLLDLPTWGREFRFVRPDGEIDDVFHGVGHGLVEDPLLFWRLDSSSNAAGATVNRLGLRGWLPHRPKGPRDLRIACVGDSCTFGVAVRYEDAFGMRLERALQEALPDRCVEVILAALPGYSSHQSRLLFERHIAALSPDVTILYCGAWNDYLPAVGWTDAQRSRSNFGGLRLAALIAAAFGPRAAAVERHLDDFRAGRAPFGQRVSLDEFRNNLRAIVRRARDAGSRVIALMPPIPERTATEHPVGAAYHDAVRAIARDEHLPLVDGAAVFRAHAGGNLFADWVHPTAQGHAVLAGALLPVVRDQFANLPTPTGASAGDLQIEAVNPLAVPALATTAIQIEGLGLGRAAAFDRVFVGGRWMPDVSILDARRIQVRLTRCVPPGQHAIELRTAAGLVRSSALLTVGEPVAPELRARAWRADGVVHIAANGPATGDLLVAVWLSSGRRAQPSATVHGPFHLETGRAAADHASPLRLDEIELPRIDAATERDGGFRVECVVPPAFDRPGTDVFVQGVLFDPFDASLGVVTQVARIELPH